MPEDSKYPYEDLAAPYSRAAELLNKPFEWAGKGIAELLNEGAIGYDKLTGRRPLIGPEPEVFGQTRPIQPPFGGGQPLIHAPYNVLHQEPNDLEMLTSPETLSKVAALVASEPAVLNSMNPNADVVMSPLQQIINRFKNRNMPSATGESLAKMIKYEAPEETAFGAPGTPLFDKQYKAYEDARIAGERAKAMGRLAEKDNPYLPDTIEHEAWMDGFAPEKISDDPLRGLTPEQRKLFESNKESVLGQMKPEVADEVKARLRQKAREKIKEEKFKQLMQGIFTDEPGAGPEGGLSEQQAEEIRKRLKKLLSDEPDEPPK